MLLPQAAVTRPPVPPEGIDSASLPGASVRCPAPLDWRDRQLPKDRRLMRGMCEDD
jgi:hypothetical protein